MIISVGGKEAPQSLTKIEAAAYGGAPSAQGSRALDRGRDAISEVGRQSIAGSSAGNRTVPSKKTPRGECPIAALSPSRVTDEANFGWRCWRRECPRTRCGSGAGGVAQIAPGIDAFTRHTGLQRQQDPLVRLKLKRLLPPPQDRRTNPAGALAIGTRSIATPMNRTVADAVRNKLAMLTVA